MRGMELPKKKPLKGNTQTGFKMVDTYADHTTHRLVVEASNYKLSIICVCTYSETAYVMNCGNVNILSLWPCNPHTTPTMVSCRDLPDDLNNYHPEYTNHNRS